MKKIILLLTFVFTLLSAHATVTVCDSDPDENGHFNSPYIKSGSITWNDATKTLTLNNAVVEYTSDSPYDYIYPVRATEDVTIIIQGECKLTTTGYVALCFEGTNSKNVTIQGDGRLYISSILRGIFLICTRLTIKDITLQNENSIMNNGDGVLCALTFDNVQANIKDFVGRIGEGITFKNCSITYPEDAYIAHNEYGYYIACGNDERADNIVISRDDNNHGGLSGDLDGNGMVDVEDVNAAINIILKFSTVADYPGNGDIDGNNMIDVEDVNAMINIILKL